MRISRAFFHEWEWTRSIPWDRVVSPFPTISFAVPPNYQCKQCFKGKTETMDMRATYFYKSVFHSMYYSFFSPNEVIPYFDSVVRLNL